MLSGSFVAVVTPMHSDGSLDLPALCKLIDFHIVNGTSGIVIVGTTGESPTVDFDEHCLLIKTAVEHAAGRIPIIAGTGANSTVEAIALTRYAKEVGAEYSLSVVPYYNKPTQEGLYQHFRKIVESVDLPMILYNVPGRTVTDIHNDTVLRLAQLPGIVGLKDATSDLARSSDLLRRLALANKLDFSILSGNDDTALASLAMGGHGVISVTANVAPKAMAEMCLAALTGDFKKARQINQRLLPLHLKLFVEANPIPVKWALQEMAMIESGIRLPLTTLSPQYHETVRGALREAGVFKVMEMA